MTLGPLATRVHSVYHQLGHSLPQVPTAPQLVQHIQHTAQHPTFRHISTVGRFGMANFYDQLQAHAPSIVQASIRRIDRELIEDGILDYDETTANRIAAEALATAVVLEHGAREALRLSGGLITKEPIQQMAQGAVHAVADLAAAAWQPNSTIPSHTIALLARQDMTFGDALPQPRDTISPLKPASQMIREAIAAGNRHAVKAAIVVTESLTPSFAAEQWAPNSWLQLSHLTKTNHRAVDALTEVALQSHLESVRILARHCVELLAADPALNAGESLYDLPAWFRSYMNSYPFDRLGASALRNEDEPYLNIADQHIVSRLALCGHQAAIAHITQADLEAAISDENHDLMVDMATFDHRPDAAYAAVDYYLRTLDPHCAFATRIHEARSAVIDRLRTQHPHANWDTLWEMSETPHMHIRFGDPRLTYQRWGYDLSDFEEITDHGDNSVEHDFALTLTPSQMYFAAATLMRLGLGDSKDSIEP